MPSINDNGSTRSVVHTPDKVIKDFSWAIWQMNFFAAEWAAEKSPRLHIQRLSEADFRVRKVKSILISSQIEFSPKTIWKIMIAPRSEASEPRRLPFAIEKTIHNILFIKTHMQRQDEFDAVIHLFFISSSSHISARWFWLGNLLFWWRWRLYGWIGWWQHWICQVRSNWVEIIFWLAIASSGCFLLLLLLLCYILSKV